MYQSGHQQTTWSVEDLHHYDDGGLITTSIPKLGRSFHFQAVVGKYNAALEMWFVSKVVLLETGRGSNALARRKKKEKKKEALHCVLDDLFLIDRRLTKHPQSSSQSTWRRQKMASKTKVSP